MANYTPPPEIQPNTEGTAEVMNIALQNPLAIIEGAEGSPRIDIKALPAIELINRRQTDRRNTGNGQVVEWRLENDFNHEQLPFAAFIFGLNNPATGDDERVNFSSTGRIILLDINVLDERLIDITLRRNTVEQPLIDYDMDIRIWYYNNSF